MIYIFYGDGKGKTSSLNGMAARAKGANLNVLLIRYLKGRTTSEDIILQKMGIEIKSFHHGEKFVFQMTDDEKSQLKEIVKKSIAWLISNCQLYNVILLDEFIDLAAENVGILSEDEIVDFIKDIDARKDVVLTGHIKLLKLSSIADLITEFKSEKHYYERGQEARKGFEY